MGTGRVASGAAGIPTDAIASRAAIGQSFQLIQGCCLWRGKKCENAIGTSECDGHSYDALEADLSGCFKALDQVNADTSPVGEHVSGKTKGDSPLTHRSSDALSDPCWRCLEKSENIHLYTTP